VTLVIDGQLDGHGREAREGRRLCWWAAMPEIKPEQPVGIQAVGREPDRAKQVEDADC
jgi:hypothetical protein